MTESDHRFDIDGDGAVTPDDHEHLIWNLLETRPGDSNLDRVFDSDDLIRTSEYDDGIADNSTWAEGDWNGDGDFDSSDLILAFKIGQYVPNGKPATNALAAAVDFVHSQNNNRARYL